MPIRFHKSLALTLALAGTLPLAAKNKHKQPPSPPQDQIAVAAHLALPGGPIVRFVPTQHYDRSYVYVERAPGQPVTLLDVTKASQPTIVSELDGAASANLVAVAGTSALASTSAQEAAAPAQTLRLMDFSDPAHPKLTQQFDGVTAVQKLQNGIILVANADGVWVLRERLAEDPKAEASYAYKVVYGESMYH